MAQHVIQGEPACGVSRGHLRNLNSAGPGGRGAARGAGPAGVCHVRGRARAGGPEQKRGTRMRGAAGGSGQMPGL